MHKLFITEKDRMKTLLWAGLLYLIGVATILVIRPTLMFKEDGQWKEFGIGRNDEHYTWMPFWLFAITWAMLSYLIVLSFSTSEPVGNLPVINMEDEMITASKHNKKNNSKEMKSGYYVLDIEETAKRGIPKYIYLGPESPNLVYRGEE
jgi:hypothetical protein